MKKCIWCNNILDKSNPDEVSHCVCLECATRVRSVLSIEDVKTKRAKKQKAVEVFNKVRVFALEARKNLEKIGFSKDTIKQILSLDKFSVDDVKECKYCNTVNMLFEGKTECGDNGKERIFHWYKCYNCERTTIIEVTP